MAKKEKDSWLMQAIIGGIITFIVGYAIWYFTNQKTQQETNHPTSKFNNNLPKATTR